MCFLGAFVEIFISQILHKHKKILTPLVTGIVITIIGISLIRVGMTDLAGILVLLGMFPIIGAVLQQIPKPVLGGATLVMFGTVAAAGIKILANETLDRRNLLIMAASFGIGLGVTMTPDLLAQMPDLVRNVFGSAVTAGGLTAIILTLILPQEETEKEPLPDGIDEDSASSLVKPL